VLSSSPLCSDNTGSPVTCDLLLGAPTAWTCTALTNSGIVAKAVCCGEPPLQVLNFDN
jgi:hypothetical protein